jgi:hypothetical protein
MTVTICYATFVNHFNDTEMACYTILFKLCLNMSNLTFTTRYQKGFILVIDMRGCIGTVSGKLVLIKTKHSV